MTSDDLPPDPASGSPGHRPPPPSSSPAWSRLRRARTGTMLGGVCRGLADATGIDVVLWRAGFLALALAGAGLIGYAVLWIVLPPAPLPDGVSPAPLDGVVDRLHTAVTAALAGSRR